MFRIELGKRVETESKFQLIIHEVLCVKEWFLILKVRIYRTKSFIKCEQKQH
jgi:hypothetical protein